MDRYAHKHRWRRVEGLPDGIEAPKRVRIYRRNTYFVLQWWDTVEKRTLSERVEGDLLTTLARAREIDERLNHSRSGQRPTRRVSHEELVQAFLADLHRRADASEIDPKTVMRYSAALRCHYLPFATRPDVEHRFRFADTVNRDFRLELANHLNSSDTPRNGHPNSLVRAFRGQQFVLDVARAMYRWAADRQRGDLLPDRFENPFFRTRRQRRCDHVDQFGQPDITLAMAEEFFAVCDPYQLRLFAPLALYGLRPSELCFLFREHIDQQTLAVLCQPDLDYFTKGGRDKRLPLVACVQELLLAPASQEGLLFFRRRVAEGSESPHLARQARSIILAEFTSRQRQRCARSAVQRRRVRDETLRHAGGITYDHIAREFKGLHRISNWPVEATLKDFRHLCSTCLENAGMPEHYRKYLLGQSPGRAAIVTYTHLNKIREHYDRAAESELAPVVEAISCRHRQLGGGSILAVG